jgi:hypothetical protein
MSKQQTLHQSDLTMQVKSGGVLSGSQEQYGDDYTGSLRPTTEGELIRTQGDFRQECGSFSSMEQTQM